MVYGERLEELLPAMVAICTGGVILSADTDPRFDQDMLSLSLSLPSSAGSSLRRALLRSQAEIMRRQADSVGMSAPLAACVHCRESEAMLAVAEQLQRVARAVGFQAKTIGERALLLGQFTPSAPCRCRRAC